MFKVHVLQRRRKFAAINGEELRRLRTSHCVRLTQRAARSQNNPEETNALYLHLVVN